jgi:hypothetical protein
MKAFRSIPRAVRRSHWRLVLPGIPSEGTLLQIPSSGSNLEPESWPSGGCRLSSVPGWFGLGSGSRILAMSILLPAVRRSATTTSLGPKGENRNGLR